MSEHKGSTWILILLIAGNAFLVICGLALYAVAIWVAVDSYKVYPFAEVSGKDDIFAASWIAIFTGFAFFCTAIYGIFAAIRRSRSMLLLYLVLMLVIYIFECASAITAATHRDYLVGNSNLLKKQMLKYYTDNSEPGRKLTATWNRVMLEMQCCGTDSPLDWIDYTSTFRSKFPAEDFPWPLNCCKRKNNYEVININGCRIGNPDYVFAKGCFEYIGYIYNQYAWAVCWLGFAILMFVLPLLILTMVFYTQL